MFSARGDKWAGEDEDDSVKDNWDDEDEDEDKTKVPQINTSLETPVEKAFERAKKKKYAKIKEKEAEEELTQEELEALKIKEDKERVAQEIHLVKDAFGSSAISHSDPITKDDFDALRKRIIADLSPFSKRAPYPDFLEDLIQDLAIDLNSKRLKKVKTTVEALYFEKAKAEKVTKNPSSAKTGKTKVKLNVEADKSVLQGRLDDDYDEFDDFM